MKDLKNKVIQGECLDWLKKIPSKSIDTLITDPPAGISFMGKSWDDDKGGRDEWIEWLTSVLKECNRVLKPGATALVWAIPRTSHWTATAIENAGFQIKDIIMHIFGSGFPKSHNIGKSTDKKEWVGYGTALKPAAEHWILAQKKPEGTYANNALKWGVAGLNIDGGRISTDDNLNGGEFSKKSDKREATSFSIPQGNGEYKQPQGRFPANIILDEEAGKMLDEQSGDSKGFNRPNLRNTKYKNNFIDNDYKEIDFGKVNMYDDKGGASRFFYCAKASKAERNAGCEELKDKQMYYDDRRGGSFDIMVKRDENGKPLNPPRANNHPTVKPLKLMEYLCTLTKTPTGGIVLDPFAGSGTTGVACQNTGRDFILIEREKEYIDIIKARLSQSKQKKLTEEERRAYALVGSHGGKSTLKKHGRKYMSTIGKRGAEKRWAKK